VRSPAVCLLLATAAIVAKSFNAPATGREIKASVEFTVANR
jgi:hypothetical protein